MRAHLRTLIVLALAAGLLAVFLRRADLAQVWQEVLRARAELVLAGLVITALTYALRALRWQYLLAPIGPTHFSTAFRTTVIGFAASALLPARAGEFLRPYLLARREGLSFTACFATIVVERLLDTVMVLLLFASFLLIFDPGMAHVDPVVFRAVKLGGLGGAALSVATLAVLFFLAGHPATLQRVTAGLQAILPASVAGAVARLVRTFAEGLAIVRQPRRLLVALVLSLPLWLSLAAGIWAVSRAFGLPVPFTGSFLLMAILVVGVAVPTPGAVGGFHEAYRIGATAFYGVANDKAVGAAIVLHAVSFLPVALAGVAFLAQDGLSLAGLGALARTRDQRGQA